MKLFRLDIDRRCLPAPRLGHRTPCFADGAVGIENTTGRNFKELEGMPENPKALKKNDPYWPLNGPSFFSALRFRRCIFSHRTKGGVSSGQTSRHGWQADDRTSPETGCQTGATCYLFGWLHAGRKIPRDTVTVGRTGWNCSTR
jgi:hypothetical protein